jgi:diguanylate cyclase (GGDEF)-like protein/PAS domain S-box-containing protein
MPKRWLEPQDSGSAVARWAVGCHECPARASFTGGDSDGPAELAGAIQPGTPSSSPSLATILEGFRVQKDETVFPVSLTVAPILDEAGAVTGTTAIPRDVAEQRRGCEAAQHVAAIVENSEDAIISGTLDGTITSWNPAAERMYGYSSAEIIGKSAAVLSTEGRVGETRATLARIGAGGQVERVETTRVRKDGTTISVSLTFSPICHPDGTVVGVSTIARDLTEQQHAAKNARNLVVAEELVHTVMAAASFGIAMTDSDGFIKVVNHSLCDLLGRDQAWFLGRRFSETVHPNDADEATRARVRLLAAANNTISGQLRLVRADGATVWVRHLVVPVQARVGQPDLRMIQVEDITAEHDAQEALGYQAFHDPLTGLHNRAWILDILKADLRAAKLVGSSVGTLFVDLDKFNVVNDSLGHEAGDEVLTTVAERIVAVLGSGDRVGRFGGDSFVIVVRNVVDVVEVECLAGRVSASIAADLQVRGHRIVPTASIGIAVSTLTSTPRACFATRTQPCSVRRPPAEAAGSSSTTRCTPRLWPA